MSFTVTATEGGSTANGIALAVRVLTGQSASPIGTVASATNTTPNLAITPGQTGSLVFGSLLGISGTYSVNGATTNIQDAHNIGGLEMCSFVASSTSTAGTPETLGYTTTGANSISVALCEIRGTLATDGSTPAAVNTAAASTITTAAFTPPAGSILVALVQSNGGASATTMALTDSSGLGLVWTEQVKQNVAGDGYSGIWTAVMPAVYVVQVSTANSGFSGNFASNVTPGNTIVMVATGHVTSGAVTTSAPLYNGASVMGAAKILSNQTPTTGFAAEDIWLLPNVQSAGTSYSITTNSQTGTFVGIFAYEVAGLGVSPVLDKSNSQVGVTTSDQSSGASGAITSATEFILGVNVQDGTRGAGYPPAGWTSTTLPSTPNSQAGYQVTTSLGGSYTYDCGVGNADWASAVVTIAPTPPGIHYNTGTTAHADGVTQATAFTFTIPSTVLVGDVMLVPIECFTYTSSSPSLATPTSGGGNWQAVSPGLVDGGAASGLNAYSSVWWRAATASDPGSTFTVSFSGTQGAVNAFYWTAELASYTGANTTSPIDVVAHNGPAGVNTYPSQPTAVTNTAGDWSVVITTADVGGSGTISTAPATNRTLFNHPASGCVALSDSNGGVGLAGTTIGGAGDSFTYSAQGQGVQWTIGLAPPASGTPVYGFGMLMGIFP